MRSMVQTLLAERFHLRGKAGIRTGGRQGRTEGRAGEKRRSCSNRRRITALQEQAGLKLEAMRAAMDVLVIEHAEKPSEN
jgi:uncharacterized protein (TIGR03435 family)